MSDFLEKRGGSQLSSSNILIPRLIVLTGPLGGTVFQLDRKVTVGRGSNCVLRIKQSSVSRLHCFFETDGDDVKVVDCSSWGTLVNGIPVREHFLVHGDRIEVGNSLLLFLSNENPLVNAQSVEIDEDTVARSAVQLCKQNALYLDIERLTADLRSPIRTIRDLHVMLGISTTLSSHRSLETLQAELLKAILEAVPGESCAIILLHEGLEDFSAVASLNRSAESNQPMRVSRTVVGEVIQKGVALLCNDSLTIESPRDSECLDSGVDRSLLCAPLTDREGVFGVIYLRSADNDRSFDQRHLELLTAIAGIASIAIENVRNIEWLRGERERLHDELGLKHAMIGESRKMRDVLQIINKVARTDSNVLISGESGTGKELVAQAIYSSSERCNMPFIAINCAALTETLLESELFGHEKGAFTGAIAQKKGKLEIADGGTLFLDEIGELNLSLQAKLLRVLQERMFERVGGTRTVKVNIRIIAATNRNLHEAIARGVFRDDLYFRLNVIQIEMPPLRDRREDIPILARYFAAKFGDSCNRRIEGLSREASGYLMSYGWPGNVRELANAIERAVVLGSGPIIGAEDLPETVRTGGRLGSIGELGFYDTLKVIKKQLIIDAIDKAQGKHCEAAKVLGIHPNNLHRLLRTLDLKTE